MAHLGKLIRAVAGIALATSVTTDALALCLPGYKGPPGSREIPATLVVPFNEMVSRGAEKKLLSLICDKARHVHSDAFCQTFTEYKVIAQNDCFGDIEGVKVVFNTPTDFSQLPKQADLPANMRFSDVSQSLAWLPEKEFVQWIKPQYRSLFGNKQCLPPC